MVGYRWFDTKKIEPLYPFGYGLSYTSFAFENAKANKAAYASGETISVSINVKNTGKTDGKEVVQLYASKSDSKVTRAAKELKGFKKVFLKAGSSQPVTIQVPVKELAYYDVASKKWIVEPGKYTLSLGNSSRDIKKEIVVNIK
ncbi:Thermostable beta-glucosidase B [compost metagenome]